MRFAHTDELLDLNHAQFRGAIADIASAIRGIPKDELASEEVRQHRRTIRTAWAAGIVVVLLGIAAGIGAIVAVNQSNEAQTQRDEAQTQRDVAERLATAEAEARAEADASATFANVESDKATAAAEAEAEARAEAETNADLARSRELAASAINTLDSDPELSILLALEALGVLPEGERPPLESTVALREAVHATNVIDRVTVAGGENAASAALAPDGRHLVWLSEDSVTIRMLDTSTWSEVWTYTDLETPDYPSEIYFSADGSQLVFSLMDSSVREEFQGFPTGTEVPDDEKPARVVVLDATSGTVQRELTFGSCPYLRLGPVSPDGQSWPIVTSDSSDCGPFDPDWHVEILDATTFESQHSFAAPSEDGVTERIRWSADGEVLVRFPGGAQDVSTGDMLAVTGFAVGDVSPRELEVAGATPGFENVWLIDLERLIEAGPEESEPPVFADGIIVSLQGIAEGEVALDVEYSADWSWLLAGSRGNGIVVWDLDEGQTLFAMPATGPVTVIEYDNERMILYHVSDDAISTWDLSGRAAGELNSGTAANRTSQGNATVARGSQGAFLFFGDFFASYVGTFDADTGIAGEQSLEVNTWSEPAVLPDGRIVTMAREGPWQLHQAGPVVAWDPEDGSMTAIVGCSSEFSRDIQSQFGQAGVSCSDPAGEWLWADSFLVDPSGQSPMVTDWFGDVHVFDAETLEPTASYALEPGTVREFGGDWVVQSEFASGFSFETGFSIPAGLRAVDLGSWETLAEIPGTITALSRDGSLLAVHLESDVVAVYDTASWEAFGASADVGDVRVRGLEFSPDGSMLMTSATDGFVRVWDVAAMSELHRVPLAGVSDGYWIDNNHIAVNTTQGLWTTLTLDIDDLIDLALDRLSRGFTEEECAIYRIDPCPTLDEMKSR